MNAFDWLQNLPFADTESACKVVEVSFNNGSRKDFFRNNALQHFDKGEQVTVEGVSGVDVGEINLTGEIVRLQLRKRGINEFDPEMKKVLRRANERDLELLKVNKAREAEAVIRARAIARQLKLEMKISEVEIQADGRKATFFYIADDRVDFRELIKIYASEFKVKVEMRQIGARQEAAKVGGIGSCGRELCCSTWLTDFKSVNTTAARYQNLSINQTKLSGQCGRLKCCLNYELDTYLDALQGFPDRADTIRVARGTANLIKKDIFKNLMWYVLPESNKQYPLTIERVRKIQSLNAQGITPDELEAVDVTSSKPKEVEPEFVDVVGQISLRSLEKNDRRRKQQQQQQRQKPAGPRAGGGQQPGREPREAREQREPRGQVPPQGGQGGRQGQQPKPQGQQPKQQQGQPRPQGQQGQGRQQPGGDRPQGNRPQGERPQGGRPQGGERQQRPPRQGGQQRPGGPDRQGGERPDSGANTPRNEGPKE
ncbi:regulatory iron-sulfur-containing complex subunit RicT [Flavihumibacter stibioxidans]|uniref:regulatory iron-sulfur-containing complex subunit RicT n=1 Tax=Flavihumibacter stibioxidans TaxID=1834163 RepID=UPI001FEA9B92|nr:regulatory iron-sulfur-containing complex subunit RicT [Flavihumibacter stibioxidans]